MRAMSVTFAERQRTNAKKKKYAKTNCLIQTKLNTSDVGHVDSAHVITTGHFSGSSPVMHFMKAQSTLVQASTVVTPRRMLPDTPSSVCRVAVSHSLFFPLLPAAA
jgi:hypothetical protein